MSEADHLSPGGSENDGMTVLIGRCVFYARQKEMKTFNVQQILKGQSRLQTDGRNFGRFLCYNSMPFDVQKHQLDDGSGLFNTKTKPLGMYHVKMKSIEQNFKSKSSRAPRIK